MDEDDLVLKLTLDPLGTHTMLWWVGMAQERAIFLLVSLVNELTAPVLNNVEKRSSLSYLTLIRP